MDLKNICVITDVTHIVINVGVNTMLKNLVGVIENIEDVNNFKKNHMICLFTYDKDGLYVPTNEVIQQGNHFDQHDHVWRQTQSNLILSILDQYNLKSDYQKGSIVFDVQKLDFSIEELLDLRRRISRSCSCCNFRSKINKIIYITENEYKILYLSYI